MIKVSVIVPVYNSKEYLKDCLECLINQTLNDVEIICINDGSTDGSEKILEEFAQKYNNIVVMNQTNAGQSAARNAGLKIASGKYIYCMDSDDLLIATALEELWFISEEKKLDVIYFSATTFYENKHLQEKRTDFENRYLRKGDYKEILSGKEFLVKLYENGDYIVSTCLQFIRREFLNNKEISFYEGIIHEDNLFGFNVLIKADRVFCLNDIYFYRRVREDSVMTKRETSSNLYGYFTCLMNQLKLASEEIWTEQQREAVLRILRGLLYHVRRIYKSLSQEEREIFLSKCNLYNQFTFETFLLNNNIELNEANVKKSVYIRKRLRTCIRVLRRSGISGVFRVIRDKF